MLDPLLVPISMHIIFPDSAIVTAILYTDFPLLIHTRLLSAGYYELNIHPPPLSEPVT